MWCSRYGTLFRCVPVGTHFFNWEERITLGHLRPDEINYTDPQTEILCRQAQGITDIDDFGCELTNSERLAFVDMKQRIRRRVSRVIDEELKRCIYKIKTGNDL